MEIDNLIALIVDEKDKHYREIASIKSADSKEEFIEYWLSVPNGAADPDPNVRKREPLERVHICGRLIQDHHKLSSNSVKVYNRKVGINPDLADLKTDFILIGGDYADLERRYRVLYDEDFRTS